MASSLPPEASERNAFGRLVGLSIDTAADGVCHAHLQTHPEHFNAHGVMHGGVLFSLADTAMGAALYTLLDADESFTWTAPLAESSFVQLLPNDRVWTIGQTHGELFRDGLLETSLSESVVWGYWVAGEDGSLLRALPDDPRILIRMLPDGSEAWRLALPSELSPNYVDTVLNEQGVLFAILGNTIAAIQTDVLPPPGCFRVQCNFQRSGWVLPE